MFVIVELPVALLIDMPVPAILDKTPVLLTIGSDGLLLLTAIPIPAFTEVTVPPPAGTAQTLSPLKKFNDEGEPMADN